MPFCNIWQGASFRALLGRIGGVGEFVQSGGMRGLPWGLLCGTSGRMDLCMVPFHSCHVYGIWTSRSKNVWGMLKSHRLGVAMQVKKGGSFIGKTCSHCVMLYCETLLQVLLGIYCKRFYWIPLSATVVLRVWGSQNQKCNSECPNETLNGLFQKNFLGFLLYPWKFIILNPTPLPLCLFFSIIVFVL